MKALIDEHLQNHITSIYIGTSEVAYIQPHINEFGCTIYTAYSKLSGFEIGHSEIKESAVEFIHAHLDELFINLEWPGEEEFSSCIELQNLLKTEIQIIKKHLERHKYFQHITDEQYAAIDFCKKYGWIMKELYCLNCCKKRHACKHAKDLKSGYIERNPMELE